jgi:hypothetical protein
LGSSPVSVPLGPPALASTAIEEAEAAGGRGDRHGGPIRNLLTRLAFSWKAA